MEVEAIFGPPGTGKTTELVKIAHDEAQRSRGVLYLSYTRAAAEEATSRARDNRIRPSTLHSHAFNALGMQRAAVVDKDKLRAFGKMTGIPFMGTERGSDEPQEGDEYLSVFEYANNRIIDHESAWDRFGRPGTLDRFRMFAESYAKWKNEMGYMDFDDMLIQFTRATHVKLAAECVILDEAQDCTPQQWLAFIQVCSNAKRVYIAGDDDQAIYEWSGANPHGMIEFAEVNSGKVRVLQQSHRVPEAAHRLSHDAALKHLHKRVPKEFLPRAHPGKIMTYGDIWNIDLRKWDKSGGGMILVRDRFRLAEVKKALNREMIPYDVLGGYSPWTSDVANKLRAGDNVVIPPSWATFYRHWDPKAPVRVTLSTIHQAKGREAKRVILDLGLPARVLHNFDLDPDPEYRVLYVALTRCSEELALCGNSPLL